MFIPRIHDASPKANSRRPRRRRHLHLVIDLERLEVRTPLSAGIGAGLGAPDNLVAPSLESPVERAITIVDGPPVWPGGIGPSEQPPGVLLASTPWSASPLPLLSPGGLTTLALGGDEVGSEPGWVASGLPTSIAPHGTTDLITPYGSAYSTDPEGVPSSVPPVSTESYSRLSTSSDFLVYSNDHTNWFVASTDVPEPFAATDWSVTIDLVVFPGAGPIGPVGPAQQPAPISGMDINPRVDVSPTPFDTDGIATSLDVSGPGYDIGFDLPGARGVVPRLDTGVNDIESNFAGSVSSAPTSAISASLQIMAIPTLGGRATTGGPNQSGVGLAIQADHSSEPLGGGWMSYVTGDWSSRGMLPAGDSLNDSTTAPVDAGDPTAPSAIADGTAPLSVLLTGPEVPTQATAGDVEQVAELIPPSESSLALVATLWTVPSLDLTGAHGDQRVDVSSQWSTDAAIAPSWTAYMIGLDQALEQSRQELHQAGSPGQPQRIPTERDQLEVDRQLEWERPIMPVATGAMSDRRGAPPGDTVAGIDDAAIDAIALDRMQIAASAGSSVRTVEPRAADEGATVPFVKAGAVALLSALSASAAVSGWLWTRRIRKDRPGLPEAGTRGT